MILSAGLKELVELDSPQHGRVGAVYVKYNSFREVAGDCKVVCLDPRGIQVIFSLNIEPSIYRDTIRLRSCIGVESDHLVIVLGGFGHATVKERYSEEMVKHDCPELMLGPFL